MFALAVESDSLSYKVYLLTLSLAASSLTYLSSVRNEARDANWEPPSLCLVSKPAVHYTDVVSFRHTQAHLYAHQMPDLISQSVYLSVSLVPSLCIPFLM